MKKILLPLLLSLAISASAAAAQHAVTEKGDNFYFQYPVFTDLNPLAEMRMNRDIKNLVNISRKDLNTPDIATASTGYSVHYEDEKYISLLFVNHYYYDRAAHGMYYTHGIVYDKTTGRRVPYTHFAPALDSMQLKQDIIDKKYSVYVDADSLTQTSDAPFITYMDNFKVSEDFIIGKGGSVYLIYQPYDLDCYAAGPTFVKIK